MNDNHLDNNEMEMHNTEIINDDSHSAKSKKRKKEQPPFFSIENFRSLGFWILCIFAIRSSIAAPYEVPTASMEPTIKVGDRILANKLSYGLKIPFTDIEVLNWSNIKRGDIIVFKYPISPDTDYVKRVVAISGDKVKVQNNILYINEKPLERLDASTKRDVLIDIADDADRRSLFVENLDEKEYYIMQDNRGSKSSWPSDGLSYTVPKDSVFVMGDNRDNSLDSRSWFQVPIEYVRGKAEIILWSAYSPKEKGASWDVRWYRFFSSLYKKPSEG